MTPSVFRKDTLVRELLDALERALATAVAAQKATHEAATHAEAKPENDKDTRALEQSYLARGQAKRALELAEGLREASAMPIRALKEGDAISLSALIEVDQDGERRHLLLCPAGGGMALANNRVAVITPEAPLGQALIGKSRGDTIEVMLGGKMRELEIISVR
jgi:transcription elongation GreA/GreB family factor